MSHQLHQAYKSTAQEFILNTSQPRGPRTGPAAYARAARKYGFARPTFTGRNGVVFKEQFVVSGGGTEVPAEDIQNGIFSGLFLFLMY